jgi:aspartyl-tRNA(Asn)/glutamyl-tRNA(Gln) amidotransferase subunit A
MHSHTLAELAKKLHAKEFSVTELTQSLLKRIEAAQPKLNAFITVTGGRALAPARPPVGGQAAGSGGALTRPP